MTNAFNSPPGDLPGPPAAGSGQVQPYSLLPASVGECEVVFTLGGEELTVQSALTNNFLPPVELPVGVHRLEVRNSSSCPGLEVAGLSTTLTVTEGDSTSVIFWLGDGLEVKQSQNLNRIEMPSGGKPYVKVLWSGERET